MKTNEDWKQEKEEMKTSMYRLEQLNEKLQSLTSPSQSYLLKIQELEDALSVKETKIIEMQDQEIGRQRNFEEKQEGFEFLFEQAKKELDEKF